MVASIMSYLFHGVSLATTCGLQATNLAGKWTLGLQAPNSFTTSNIYLFILVLSGYPLFHHGASNEKRSKLLPVATGTCQK